MRNVSAERFWLELAARAEARSAPPELAIDDEQLRPDPARLVMPGTFRLDGADGHPGLGEQTFAGHTPLAMFTLAGETWQLVSNALRVRASERFDEDRPFAPLSRVASLFAREGDAPFTGAMTVSFSYELGERLLGLPSRPSTSPDAVVSVHDRVAMHTSGGWRVRDAGLRDDGEVGRAAWAAALPTDAHASAGVAKPVVAVVGDSLGGAAYRAALERVKGYIAAGDIYQANLTRMLTLELDRDAHAYYRALLRAHPGPFSCFMVEPGGATICGISPELFLRVSGRDVETRPIKGTRPRGASTETDAELRDELLASEKDAAELVMIVDLMRNDLGRVAEYGSVRVVEPKRLDSHPTLHHLSGVVRARLRDDADLWELLAATLPAGSITGAPKRRAVEILQALEPHARGVYTGAVGIIDFQGHAILNVAIRTLRIVGRRAILGVGGGIVADSEADAELRETNDKARAFLMGARVEGPV